MVQKRLTQRSQNVTWKLAKIRYFLEKLPFLLTPSMAGRSLMENDGPVFPRCTAEVGSQGREANGRSIKIGASKKQQYPNSTFACCAKALPRVV